MAFRLISCTLACVVLAGCGDAATETAENETPATQESSTESTETASTETDGTKDNAESAESTAKPEEEEMSGPLNFEMETLAGEKIALSKYKGKVVLMVNVASKCGLTPQYENLQALHAKYAEKGLSVVGIPCNQFGGQEPGTAEEIQQFCSENYGVEFDMLAKVDVNGDGACDLYKYLTALETKPQGPGNIGWNFEKFLIDRSGKVINRFSTRTTPDDGDLVAAIETALAATP